MADARLSILLSADTTQAEAGLNKLVSVVNKTEAGVESAVTGIAGDFQRLSTSADKSFSSLQAKVQGFGGGAIAFKAPKIDLSSIKPISPDVSASFKAVSDALDLLGRKGFISLGSVTAAMKELQVVIRATSNTGDLAKLNIAYEQLAAKSRQLKGVGLETSFNKLGQSSNQANQALINTGRVIQDLPFGFLGIANNLNPLLESFQRLKAQTGSTGSALKSLASSLSGAGGIGLALSLVSSALIVFGDALFGSTKGFSSAELFAGRFSASLDRIGKSADELKTKLQFARELSDLNAELSGLQGFELALAKINNRLKEQTAVNIKANVDLASITKAKEVMDRFADGIRKTASEAQSAGLPIDKLGKLLLSFKDVREIPEGLISKLNTKEAAALQLYIKTLKDFDDVTKRSVDSQQAIIQDVVRLGIEGLNKRREAQDKAKEDYKTFVSETISQGKKLADFFEGRRVVPFFSDFDSIGEQLEKAKKLIKDFKTGDLKIILKIPIQPEPEFVFQTGFLEKQLKEVRLSLLDQIRVFGQNLQGDSSKLKFNVSPTIQISPELERVRSVSASLADLSAQLLALGGTLPPIDLKLPVKVTTEILNAEIAKQQLINSINDAIASISTDSFANIGEVIGAALAGGDLSTGFKQFAAIIGDGFQQIGRQMIIAAPIIQALKAAIKTLNPAILLPAGIALVAIGAALKKSISGIKGFAEGGRPQVGKLSMITERGTEAFVSDAGKVTMLEGKGAQFFKTNVPGKIVPSYALGSIKEKFTNVISTAKITEKVFVSDASKQIEKLVNSFKATATSTISSVSSVLKDHFKSVSSSTLEKDRSVVLTNELSRLFKTTDKNVELNTSELTKIFNNRFESSVSEQIARFKDVQTNTKSENSAVKELLKYFSTDKQTLDSTFKTADSIVNKAFVSTASNSLKEIFQVKETNKQSTTVNELFNYLTSINSDSTFKNTEKLKSFVSDSKAFVSTITRSLKEVFSTGAEMFGDQYSRILVSTNLKDIFSTDSSKEVSDHFSKVLSSKAFVSTNSLKELLSTYSGFEHSNLKETNFGKEIQYHFSKVLSNIKLSDHYFKSSDQLSKILFNKTESKVTSEITKLIDHTTNKFSHLNESSRSVFNQIDKVLSKVISFDQSTVFESVSTVVINRLRESFKQLAPAYISSNTSSNNIVNNNLGSWLTKQGDFTNSIISGSSILNKIFNQVIPHREFGGAVTAGQPFLVGENGAELFIPQTAGRIIPQGNTNGLGSGIQNIVVEVIGRIAGDDIVLSNARTGAKQRRLT